MEYFNFDNDLQSKIALFTGHTKGAGKAVAERSNRAGAIVVIMARNPPQDANDGFTLFLPNSVLLLEYKK